MKPADGRPDAALRPLMVALNGLQSLAQAGRLCSPHPLSSHPASPLLAPVTHPGVRLRTMNEGSPVYVSFVNKAILWERGLCHHTVHHRPHHRPLFCPRFLSHMKARPEDLRPPCFLTSTSRPPPQEKTAMTLSLPALKTQTLEGNLHLNPDRSVQMAVRRSAVVVPCPPLPAAPPPSSTADPTPPRQNNLHHDLHSTPNAAPASPSYARLPAAPEGRDDVEERETAPQPAKLDRKLHLGPERSPPPASVTSQGSFSDLSRPPSSLFSRSTDLGSGGSSVLSGDDIGDPEGRLSPLHHHPAMASPLVSTTPAGSSPRRSSTPAPTAPPLCEPPSPRPTSPSPPRRPTVNLHPDACVDPALRPSSDRGLVTLAFPSTTWSSCPSPQRSTPRSGSGPKLTPASSRLESHRWPVLPPISPVRGRCGTAASRYSELSCSQSHVFDELEAIAPRSASCPSEDQPPDSSGCPSPDTELSPGLAALTMGCDSGNLGSLSRVQLLLLDRPEPETMPSPFGLDGELSGEDWSDLGTRYDPEGVVRPLTAGGASQRCDSAGKVQENKSDRSEGGSGSPSSWIIDPSPSHNMFGSALSPRVSNHGSGTDEGGPTEEEEEEEEANYPGWRDGVESSAGGRRSEEKEGRMEERTTKVLNILSKLQDDTPRQQNTNKGRSDFEDFDFLAKYCIFSQEKLAEYKRAFEAEDGDGDGYLSCLQALLALKNIVPSELLSDEEEIYVYRILELVDFRVTDGLVDLRLFAVIASLAQKVATMDDFMRSLITNMDLRSLEVRLFKAKQLFLFLLEEQHGDAGAQRGFISAEQLLLELKAGGIQLDQEAAVRLELQHVPPLDLLDFLAYLPLFMLIHKSVISNPLDDSSDL